MAQVGRVGAGGVAVRAQRIGQRQPCARRFGLQRGRPAQGRDRFVVAPEPGQRAAEIPMRLRPVRAGARQRAEDADRGLVVAQPRVRGREQAQGARMLADHAQDFGGLLRGERGIGIEQFPGVGEREFEAGGGGFGVHRGHGPAPTVFRHPDTRSVPAMRRDIPMPGSARARPCTAVGAI